MRHSIGIVQTHATQFDGPLFRAMAREPDLDVTAYYFAQTRPAIVADPEIGRQCPWDHDIHSGYRAEYLPEGRAGEWRLARRVVAADHDLVVVSGFREPVTLITTLSSVLTRTALGLRSDNILSEDSLQSFKGRLKAATLPLVYRLFDVGFPVGTLAAEYLEHFGFPRDRLHRFAYTVDNDWLEGLCEGHRAKRSDLRARFGVPPESFVTLGILKLHEREDPETLLSAFLSFAEGRHDAHLVIVGDGPLRGRIEAIRAAHPASARVHMVGYQPYSDLPMFFAMSDVFVHPAKHECWGVSVQESLACGVPVIAAGTVGAAHDLVEGRGTGFVFPVGDAPVLARLLERCAAEPALLEECRAKAKDVARGWDHASTIADIRRALRGLDARRGAARSPRTKRA